MTLADKMEITEKHIISGLREEIKMNMKDIKNDILNFKDDIISEIKTIRLEQAVVGSYKKTLVDHGERISTLEKKSI